MLLERYLADVASEYIILARNGCSRNVLAKARRNAR